MFKIEPANFHFSARHDTYSPHCLPVNVGKKNTSLIFMRSDFHQNQHPTDNIKKYRPKFHMDTDPINITKTLANKKQNWHCIAKNEQMGFIPMCHTGSIWKVLLVETTQQTAKISIMQSYQLL